MKKLSALFLVGLMALTVGLGLVGTGNVARADSGDHRSDNRSDRRDDRRGDRDHRGDRGSGSDTDNSSTDDGGSM